MENIKEELRQLIKDKILSTIMEDKKHPARGPSAQRPKSWNKNEKSGSRRRIEREEAKRQAAQKNNNF